jgi:hypothetical protein
VKALRQALAASRHDAEAVRGEVADLRASRAVRWAERVRRLFRRK